MRGFIVYEDRRFEYLEKLLELSGDDCHHSFSQRNEFDYIVFGLHGPDDVGRYKEKGTTHLLSSYFFSSLKSNCHLYTFCFNDYLATMAKKYHLSYRTYESNEKIINGNADLTSEAVIAWLIANRPQSLKNSTVTIFGNGHLAKSLVRYLYPIVERLKIVSRSSRDDGYLSMYGKCYRFSDEGYLDSDILINTIPARILDDKLVQLASSVTFVDISSFPYGIQLEKALEKGIQAVILPGLPAKYAYQDSAKLLYEMMIEERKNA